MLIWIASVLLLTVLLTSKAQVDVRVRVSPPLLMVLMREVPPLNLGGLFDPLSLAIPAVQP